MYINTFKYTPKDVSCQLCTEYVKNRLKGELGALHYVGIAADEAWRCKDERYPLVEWGITSAQALQPLHRLRG